MNNTLVGIGVGGVAGIALILADVVTGSAAINGASTIGLKEAVGLGVSSCGVIWWVGRKFQSLEDSVRSLTLGHQTIIKRLDAIKCEPIRHEQDKAA